MSDSIPSVEAAIARAKTAAKKLGIDVQNDLARIETFLQRRHVIAVAGNPQSGTEDVGKQLIALLPEKDTIQLPFNTSNPLYLWDTAVVVTPADRALAQVEEDFVKTCRRKGRTIAVAVTRSDLLGHDKATRKKAESEIEEFRLRPRLKPLGVPWFFVPGESRYEALSAAATNALPAEPSKAHAKPARQALASVLATAIGQLSERIAHRDRDYAQLGASEAKVPLAQAHAQQQTNLARLDARDRLRGAEDNLFAAIQDQSAAAQGWVSRLGIGDWEDVEQPLREAWETFCANVATALPTSKSSFQRESFRLWEASQADRRSLEADETAAPSLAESWKSPEYNRRLDAVINTNVEPLFAWMHEECKEEIELLKQQEKSDRGIRQRIGEGIRGVTSTPLGERISIQLHADLQAIIGPRFEKLLDAVSIAATEGAEHDLATLSDALKSGSKDLRQTIENRHAWDEAYGELLNLSTWAARTSGHHG